MKDFFLNYENCWTDRSYIFSVLSGAVFVAISFVINWYAGIYATESASNPVTDIFLSNVPVWNVDFIYTYGAMAFWVFVICLALAKPQRIPFLLKSVALFVLIRSLFISLTHLGPFPTQAEVTLSSIMNKFTFGADLFFSGHTGLPFLMALNFWNHKGLRIFFICAAIVFGISVLLGHLHYSIDVLGAFFITFSIFHMAEHFFPEDRKNFLKV